MPTVILSERNFFGQYKQKNAVQIFDNGDFLQVKQ